MKYAIYHPWLKGRGGAEKVVLEVAKSQDHEVTVFTLFYDEENTFEGFQDVDVQVVGSNNPPKSFFDKGFRFGLGAMIRKLPLEDYDALVVSEAGIGSLITIRNHDIPVLAYVHTPLRPALPEFRDKYRMEKSAAVRPMYDTGIKVYNMLEKTAWGYFHEIIANSEVTRQRIADKGLRLKHDIDVINPGADEVDEEGEFGDYIFYPSRFRRYKRQDLAIEAWKEADTGDFKLILGGSGQEGEYLDDLREMADDSIEIRTDVPEEEWKELYRNSYTVMFLAEKEDWGIVPLEAGMYGKPVIAVKEGSPAETVKDGETGYLSEPVADSIAEKIEKLVNSPEKAREMGEKGRENAMEYSWDNFRSKLEEKISEEV